MCIFCEEPLRSVMLGLAAIGLIVIGRFVHRQVALRIAVVRTDSAK